MRKQCCSGLVEEEERRLGVFALSPMAALPWVASCDVRGLATAGAPLCGVLIVEDDAKHREGC